MSLLTVNVHQPVNATSAPVTMTLPSVAGPGDEVSVEKADSSTHTVSVTGSIRGVAAQTVTLTAQYETIGFRADASGSWWPIWDHKTKAALDGSYLALATAQTPTDGGAQARANIAAQSVPGFPVGSTVGDGTADDTTALAAYLASLPAGAVADLGGLTYRITSALTLGKAVRLTRGKIVAGNHTAINITASGVVLDGRTGGLTIQRGTGSNVTDTIAQRSAVVVSAPFVSDGVAYSGTAHSNLYLTHGVCSGSTIRGGSIVNPTATQDSAGIYVASGGSGNTDITIDGVGVTGACSDGVIVFDAQRCVVRNCRVSGMTILPTVTLTGWSPVSGSVYRQRTASGTPGTTGVSTDRVDGNTRVLKNAGAILVENASTPTTPGSNQWGESGGFVYLDLGGTDPSTVTITSDIVSGYGVTFYSSANGFTTMSQNTADGNVIREVDGFGIYMQLSSYANTCTDNKTVGNVLVNVCKKGSQTTILPFAGIAWTGGLNCISMGDRIDGAGTSSFPAPGFFASDATVVCRGRAIGVVAVNGSAEGFRINNASDWLYEGCGANFNATSGFSGLLTASRVVTGLQLNSCTATGNTLAGLSIDASASGAVCSANITGGDYYANAQQGITFNTVRNTFITGTTCHDNGSTSFPQVRFVGDCLYSGVSNLNFFHALAGLSFQLTTTQSTPFYYGNLSVPTNMSAPSLGSNQLRIAGGLGGRGSISAGSGVPVIAGAVGDVFHRTDTPTTVNQRMYLCSVAGAAGAATWTAVL